MDVATYQQTTAKRTAQKYQRRTTHSAVSTTQTTVTTQQYDDVSHIHQTANNQTWHEPSAQPFNSALRTGQDSRACKVDPTPSDALALVHMAMNNSISSQQTHYQPSCSRNNTALSMKPTTVQIKGTYEIYTIMPIKKLKSALFAGSIFYDSITYQHLREFIS